MADLQPMPVFPAEATDPRFREFFDYWRRRATDGLLPGRRDIDPIDIPALLPGIVLYDVVGEPPHSDAGRMRFRFRLVGTMMCQIMGADPTGRFIDELVVADKQDAVHEAFAAVARMHCAHFWENPLWTADRSFVKLQRLALPLASDGHRVDMIIAYHVRLAEPAPA